MRRIGGRNRREIRWREKRAGKNLAGEKMAGKRGGNDFGGRYDGGKQFHEKDGGINNAWRYMENQYPPQHLQ